MSFLTNLFKKNKTNNNNLNENSIIVQEEKKISELEEINNDEQLKNNTLYIYYYEIYLNKVYDNYPIKINDFILNFLTNYNKKNYTEQQVDNNKYKNYFPINQINDVPVLELKIDNNLNIKKNFYIDDGSRLTYWNYLTVSQDIVNKYLLEAIENLKLIKEEQEKIIKEEEQEKNKKIIEDNKTIIEDNKTNQGGKYRRKSRVQKKTKTAKKSKKAVKKTARRRK